MEEEQIQPSSDYSRARSSRSNGYSRSSRDSGYAASSRSSRDSGYAASSRPSRDSGYATSSRRNGGDDQPYRGETIPVAGALEILADYGVLRSEVEQEGELPSDVYVSLSQIRRLDLRMGDTVEGIARPPKEGERYLSLLKVTKVAGVTPEEAQKRPRFERLTPIFPDEWMKLETDAETLSTRLIDLFAPIGKGQRGTIVSPPKAGKTWLLKDIANGITANHPKVKIMVALIGERPEEVTDISRSIKGQVFSSNFDEPGEDQVRIAEMCLEQSKRLAEAGEDVIIVMDSLTRLARAYNLVVPPSGRTLSGGFDPIALYPPKHFFGAARNFEKGGSLTIIATALVDTGSRMDDLIYEEFKGTGNMELHLDRNLADRRLFPAINIVKSGTRHEELLFDKPTLEQVYTLRRMVDTLGDQATELVLSRLRRTKSNKEFLTTLKETK